MIDRPLFVQFLVAGSVVAIFSMVSLILLLFQVNQQREASEWLSKTHRTISLLNTLGRDFYRQESAFRDFLKTPDARTLAAMRERGEYWDATMIELGTLIEEGSTQRELLASIQESYLGWRDLSEPLLAAVASNGNDAQVSGETLREEAAHFKSTFLLIDRLIDIENSLLGVRDVEEKGALQATFSAVAMANIALLLIFSIVLMKLYSSIARPISALSQGIGRYRDGEFTTRVPLTNTSEIGYLQTSFNEMAGTIETMVVDLKKLDQLKTDFIGTVSHELRTPLTSIRGYAKVLVNEEAGELSRLQKDFLGIIDTNAMRLTDLINDLLDVEKIESGNIQLVKERNDLIEILKECHDTFDILAKQKGLELKYEVPNEPVTIFCDRARIVQVFMNLISNAVKYTNQGSVIIQAEARDYAIVVRIRDSGVGISKEDLDKLFQKFFRTNSALTGQETGSGLGLVIVRGLVESHGGQITVESELGVGTSFIVTLGVEKTDLTHQNHSKDVNQ